MQSLWMIGNQIYRIRVWREAHRLIVFLVRGRLHHKKLVKLDTFFSSAPELRRIADSYPFVYEQPTRAFFYKDSTFDERVRLVEHHMQFLLEALRPDVAVGLYQKEEQLLWQQELAGADTQCYLSFHPGQRKEGLLSIWLRQGDASLYQIMFWLDKDRAGEWSCYIGAMQGPNMDDARDVIKRMTKACFGFRTKNLILYLLQALVRTLGIRHIYAVTNAGYYAQNHVRRDRKLKTSFSDFWLEAGGRHTDDYRFDELPLAEPRKAIEDVKSQKRNLYRKRYALLDAVDEAVEAHVRALMR